MAAWIISGRAGALAESGRPSGNRRDERACRDREREFRQVWTDVADIAPELAALDLVLAELLITHERAGK
jgi:hypothetical protein